MLLRRITCSNFIGSNHSPFETSRVRAGSSTLNACSRYVSALARTSSRLSCGRVDGAAARVADHRSEIADDQNRLMTEILKLPQLPEDQRVAEMKIRTGGIDPQFDAQRPAEREFLARAPPR